MKQIIVAIVLLGLIGYGVYDNIIKKDHKTTPQESVAKKDTPKKETSDSNANTNSASSDSQSKARKPKVGIERGDQAPDFALKTLDNKTVKLSDFRGKKVLLNFWASWCPPCNAEAPYFEPFYQKHKNENFVILSVNLTSAERTSSDITDFIKKYHFTFPIVFDPNNKVGEEYQTVSIPTSYFIDSHGLIYQKIVGPVSDEAIDSILSAMN